MKSIRFVFVCAITMVIFACSQSESETAVEGVSVFESMKSLYGIELAANDSQQLDEVPSVTLEEMRSVLEALQRNSTHSQECSMEDTEGDYGSGSDKKTLRMTAEYQARTRSGALLENFALSVFINLIMKEETVYYVGTTYVCETDLFFWKGYGASLTATADGGNSFSSTSYLYFRVSDMDDYLVKVPVSFSGNYDFTAGRGTYSFVLAKMHR